MELLKFTNMAPDFCPYSLTMGKITSKMAYQLKFRIAGKAALLFEVMQVSCYKKNIHPFPLNKKTDNRVVGNR